MRSRNNPNKKDNIVKITMFEENITKNESPTPRAAPK